MRRADAQQRLVRVGFRRIILEAADVRDVLGHRQFFHRGHVTVAPAADALALEALDLAVKLVDGAIDRAADFVLHLFLGAQNGAAFVMQRDLRADPVAAASRVFMGEVHLDEANARQVAIETVQLSERVLFQFVADANVAAFYGHVHV